MQRGCDSVVCPKPRRVGGLNCYQQPEMVDSEAGAELVDLILSKGGYGCESPYFCGSPPSRAANPLIQDAQFNGELSPTPPSPRVGGGSCVRIKFGNKPAAVRIEGFDLERRRCSVSAVA